MLKNVQQFHVKTLVLLIFIVLLMFNGCITALLPSSSLQNEDLKLLTGHKKYPLRLAVVTENMKNYLFTPDEKRGAYCYYNYKKKRVCKKVQNLYFGLIYECKDFFPRIFREVDFIKESDFDETKFDLMIIFYPIHVYDLTEESYKSVELKMEIDTEFRKADKKILLKNKFYGNGISTEGTDNWYSEKVLGNYYGAMDNVIRSIFIQLSQKLTEHPNQLDNYVNYLAKLEKEETEKKTLPANLIAKILYTDKASFSPNNTIDAGEESLIKVAISNTGKGTAFDVVLSTEAEFNDINYPRSIQVGNIQPGHSKEINLPIVAGLEIKDGTIPFLIQAKEKRGYDSKKYNLNISATKLIKPEIIITNYKINDGNTGFAKGNGNGIPENGETIEFIPLITNNGIGKAIQVNLSIASINKEIKLQHESVNIPQINAGQTVTEHLAFTIPPSFRSKEIDLNLVASDVRGVSTTNKLFTLNTITRRPVLAYNYKIIDGNGNGFLENGEAGEIEIVPVNKGEMAARDINLDLHSKDISFSNTHAYINQINAAATYVPLRFAFTTPRVLNKDSINIHLQVNQKDFPGFEDTINIPVKSLSPVLEITHQVLDQNNNGIIEKGETIDLIVKVKNSGGLRAENVVLNMEVNSEGIIQDGVMLSGNKTIPLGKIAAGRESAPQRFTIHFQRRAEAGDVPVNFTITQQDFPKEDIALSLAIEQEQPEVITVAGKKAPQQFLPVTQTMANSPPLIVIATPKDQKRTASEAETLTGTIADDKGVANVEIILNGRRLSDPRSVGGIKKTDQNNREHDFRINIPLHIGKNEIMVKAFDIENASASKSITVYREAEKGEIWAAVIGINKFKDPMIPSLKYARNDAQAFAEYLRENIGLDKNHLFELYDDEATMVNLLSLLGTKLRRKAKRAEDTVFIYFAGHGAPEKDSLSKDGDGISKYMLAHDSDPEDFYATAIHMDRIAEIFARIRAERIVFIADSCYSGGSGGRTILAQGQRANLSDAFLNRIAQAGKGRIILTSSSANEVSQESATLKHGFFTCYLLEGLRGGADLDRDNLVDIDEIYRYLNKWVPDKTNGTQHPVKKGQAEGQIIVGRIK